MKNENKKCFYFALFSLFAFVLWTVLVRTFDVGLIGQNETAVVFATINKFIHNLTGVNMKLYVITDWLGLVPIFCVIGFGLLGLFQWIKQKNLFKVEGNILILGIFYIVVFAVYFFFEMVIINYRPILINGNLEASYPSSTTMLVMCVMPTTIIQFNIRIKNKILRICINNIIIFFIIFMVIGRLISGVHWFSDIVGGILLSIGLVMMYYFINNKFLLNK